MDRDMDAIRQILLAVGESDERVNRVAGMNEEVLRFNAMAAADTDSDGDVTLDELAQVDLTTLTEGTYGTGGVGTVEDLESFVRALTRTLGHWRGEGHCHAGDGH